MENNAKKLLEQYLSGNCTPEEKAIVEDWYLQLPFERNAPHYEQIEASKEEVFQRLHFPRKVKRVVRLKRIAIAASILLCFTAGLYYLNRKPETSALLVKKELKDVLPGRNKATLTLADGRVVDLDQAQNGQIASQNGIVIRKAENGQLEYVVQDNPSGITGNNVISTPRGGQYQVSLPDGTKVWLNAATSLKYPYSFTKQERVVELNGEAYFEVAKDKHRPFRVKTNNQTVEVLGTHFNINAYSDEPLLKTTLLEGAVKVSHANEVIDLHPGDQARFSPNNDRLTVVQGVDLDQEVAWKNDIFAFDNADLKTIMRQISRWYDIDVVYKGNITTEKYFGDIPRNSNLSEVFKILQLNHIDVKISGKTMTITGN